MPVQSRSRELTSAEVRVIESALVDLQPMPLPPDVTDAAIAEVHGMILELRNFTVAMVKGDFAQTLECRGFMAEALKHIQVELRKNSFKTRPAFQNEPAPQSDFLNEFVASISPMTQQLLEAKKQLEEANRNLQQRLDTDRLTGLYNHSFLMDTLENEIERARRYSIPLSIVMLDVDHFKVINDIHGHRIGDAVLEEIARLMCQILRPSDTAGRFGGGEFMLILPNTDCEGATTLAERIRSHIVATPFTASNIETTISAGIVTWEDHRMSDLIRAAENRLQDAKGQGGNLVRGG